MSVCDALPEAAAPLPRVCLIIVFRVSGVARLVPAQGGILMNSRLPRETLKPDLEESPLLM